MRIQEKSAKTILVKTKIGGLTYCINPYTGCQHGCKYCYANFMKRFTGHREPWGKFVDIKINAPQVLESEIRRAKRGTVCLSSVTDPYQPLEKKYRLTRACLEILLKYQFPIDILTKSPLIIRDIDLLKRFEDLEVGFTITTDDENIRKIFEPKSPSIASRIQALKEIHRNGIKTYGFIAPMLPLSPEKILNMLAGGVDRIMVDKMNYRYRVRSIYEKNRLEDFLDYGYFRMNSDALKVLCYKKGIPIDIIFNDY